MRAALAQAASETQNERGGRVTAAEKIHLTLFFIGDVDRSRIARLSACASSIGAKRFSLALSTIGFWRHNRIAWAGASACPPELVSMVSMLNRNLAAEGLHAEDRPYVPHVTLVRNARGAPSRRTIEAPVWNVREFVLVESVGSQRDSRYEAIARFPLEASAKQ